MGSCGIDSFSFSFSTIWATRHTYTEDEKRHTHNTCTRVICISSRTRMEIVSKFGVARARTVGQRTGGQNPNFETDGDVREWMCPTTYGTHRAFISPADI